MSNINKYKSSIGFTDLLFNLVIGFVYLFMIAFILINPITKTGDVIKKADYILVLEWNHDLNDDIDLWVQDPTGEIVSFKKKQASSMHLELDDLGYSSDKVITDPSYKIININREVVTIRGAVMGEYKVMAHVYNRKPSAITANSEAVDLRIMLTVIQINPYIEHKLVEQLYNERGQQFSLLRFTLDGQGNYVSDSSQPSNIITQGKPW